MDLEQLLLQPESKTLEFKIPISYDQQAISDLKKEALDLETASRVFQSVGKEINEEKLRSLGVLTNQSIPTIGGIILFGKKRVQEQFIPDVAIRCARFLGDTKTCILDQLTIGGTILDAVSEVPKFIARNTR